MTDSPTTPTSLARPLSADVFTVNFVRLAGLSKDKARECEAIVRQVLVAHGVLAQGCGATAKASLQESGRG